MCQRKDRDLSLLIKPVKTVLIRCQAERFTETLAAGLILEEKEMNCRMF